MEVLFEKCLDPTVDSAYITSSSSASDAKVYPYRQLDVASESASFDFDGSESLVALPAASNNDEDDTTHFVSPVESAASFPSESRTGHALPAASAATSELIMGLAHVAGLPMKRLRLDIAASLPISFISSLFAGVLPVPESTCFRWAGAEPRLRYDTTRLYVRYAIYRLFHGDTFIGGDDDSGEGCHASHPLLAPVVGKLEQTCGPLRAGTPCLNPEHMTVIPKALKRTARRKISQNIFVHHPAVAKSCPPHAQTSAAASSSSTTGSTASLLTDKHIAEEPTEAQPQPPSKRARTCWRTDIWNRYYSALDEIQQPFSAESCGESGEADADDLFLIIESTAHFDPLSTRGVAIHGDTADLPAGGGLDAERRRFERFDADRRIRAQLPATMEGAEWVVSTEHAPIQR
jgi:hypothetical protein